MINVSTIDLNFLDILAGMYMHMVINFKCEPERASLRTQRKIIRYINKIYKEEIECFPKKVKEIFEKENNTEELLKFLKECSKEVRINGNERERKFNKATANVGEDVKSALWDLINQLYWTTVKLIDNDLEIVINDNPAFRRTITLKDVIGVPEYLDAYMLDDLWLVFKQEKKLYCIYGEKEDIVGEIREPISIRFSDAQVNVEVYNGVETLGVANNPWEYIREISFSIAQKSELPGDYCNNLEKELLPLLKDIVALENWLELPESKLASFPELKKMTEQYGYKKITKLFNEIEKHKSGSDKYNRMVNKIVSKLCNRECEPLWRDIFDKLKESQREYLNKVESRCSKNLLSETRNSIQSMMEERGYSGTYPNFVKRGNIRGLKLESSYGMTYFIANEKNVEYKICCIEDMEEAEHLTVQFLCGTAMLKKEEKLNDIYSCLFNAKGKRLFNLIHHYVKLSNDDSEECNLETSINIAVKKAECIRLSKSEKKFYYGNRIPVIVIFLSWLIFGGGMFGILLNLGMLLMSIIFSVIAGQYNEIPTLFTEIPWGWLILGSGIAFGGIMGIITVMAERK